MLSNSVSFLLSAGAMALRLALPPCATLPHSAAAAAPLRLVARRLTGVQLVGSSSISSSRSRLERSQQLLRRLPTLCSTSGTAVAGAAPEDGEQAASSEPSSGAADELTPSTTEPAASLPTSAVEAASSSSDSSPPTPRAAAVAAAAKVPTAAAATATAAPGSPVSPSAPAWLASETQLAPPDLAAALATFFRVLGDTLGLLLKVLLVEPVAWVLNRLGLQAVLVQRELERLERAHSQLFSLDPDQLAHTLQIFNRQGHHASVVQVCVWWWWWLGKREVWRGLGLGCTCRWVVRLPAWKGFWISAPDAFAPSSVPCSW